MHSLHDYIAERLAEQLAERRVVVFYDPREEFRTFINELSPDDGQEISSVHVGDVGAHFAEYEDSLFELRFRVEPIVAEAQPNPLLLYLPGVERDREQSVLMELEKGGTCYEPQLKRLARHVLRDNHTEGQIDDFLAPDSIEYSDIATHLRQSKGAEAPSRLRALYPDHTGINLIGEWLASPEDDDSISAKEATGELYQLIDARLGLSLGEETPLADARSQTYRYLLLGEFRLDLDTDPPSSIGQIPAPTTSDQRRRVRKLVRSLRDSHPDRYQKVANRIEEEFQLPSAQLQAEDLGQIDTFKFEAEVMLKHAGDLVAEEEYEEVKRIIDTHRRSYWVQRDVVRQAQWEAVRLMARLGREVQRITESISENRRSADEWFEAYTHDEEWYEVDAAHRALEDWVANMDEDPFAEQGLAGVRDDYEALLRKMAEGFSEALEDGGWALDRPLAQTQVYRKFVEQSAGPTVFILADAMRYEMGIELSRQLEAAQDMKVRPAVAQLPSVTVVGMAALLPEASKSFTVVESGGELAAQVEGEMVKNVNDRRRALQNTVPRLVDLRLEDVLQYSSDKLSRTVEEAPVILVRSQEIDALAEQGLSHLARQVMGTVIGNIGRAVRKLADVGVTSFVITADHGHQFALEKGDDMKTDPPGGDTVKLSRRCWVGRGGKTPKGAVRVQGADLGYETDLEFVFPTGNGVFRSSGDLSYHHGGPSLQELAVPVLQFRMVEQEREKQVGPEVELFDIPDKVTNRTFPVGLRVRGDLFVTEPVPLRVVLVSEEEQVGEARMAMEAEIDEERSLVLAEQGTEAMVGFILNRDTMDQVRIIVQDPQSGSVFAESDLIPVNLSI